MFWGDVGLRKNGSKGAVEGKKEEGETPIHYS